MHSVSIKYINTIYKILRTLQFIIKYGESISSIPNNKMISEMAQYEVIVR